MIQLHRILLAFDFNQATKTAIDKAVYFAKKFDSEIIPVHAVEYIPYHHGLNYWHAIYDEVKPRMEEVFKKLSENGLKVHSPIIKEGRPYDIILSTAELESADMIIIGTGKPSLAESILGTTAMKIVRNAEQLVCVVPSEESHQEIKKILCAVDLSLASSDVLTIAVDFAEAIRAKLSIMHVVPKAKHYPGLEQCSLPVVDMEASSELQPQALTNAEDLDKNLMTRKRIVFNKYLENFIAQNITYEQLLRQGQPDDEIVKAVQNENFDLLIMGTVSQGSLSRFLVGNITEKVMRKIPCSAITVKHGNLLASSVATLKSESEHTSGKGKGTRINEAVLYMEKVYENGQRLLASGAYPEAIIEFYKCIKKDKHFYAAYEALGRCYQSLGEDDKAKQYVEMAKAQRRYVWNLQYASQESREDI